jgi:hypothetical protein
VLFYVQAFLSVVSSVVDKLVHDVDTNVQATLMELRTMQSDKDGTAHISTLLRLVLRTTLLTLLQQPLVLSLLLLQGLHVLALPCNC